LNKINNTGLGEKSKLHKLMSSLTPEYQLKVNIIVLKIMEFLFANYIFSCHYLIDDIFQ